MRTLVNAMILAGAAVLATGPGAGSPAAATSTTWTVHPGGTITAAAGKTTLTDTKNGDTLTCASSGMRGTLKPGSGLPGAGIGSITVAVYQCPTPIFSYRLTPLGLPWRLTAISYDARTGVTRGTISHLQLAFSIPEVFCSAVVNGTSSTASDGVVAVSYSNKTGKLRVLPTGGTLHWYHVHNCGNLLGNGDPAALAAVYTIAPLQTITSP